ncbi:unnamed protein product [Nyctereutes procyonoides]|uniref:S-formylglutathione hydrolase n=1 Tax=Nyctereutes procyonoides TaxID=34880 RepID=A0A811YH30_NYCPR|nr:unnamed protein product [Nyctereutes procyonoides]
MYSSVTEELPQLINANFPVDPQRISIFGHSMRGCRADLSFEESWKGSVLVTKKSFSEYLETDQSSQLDILIDQGKNNQFLSDRQLLPDNFIAAYYKSYDHSYYLIATFITDHIGHPAKYLNT